MMIVEGQKMARFAVEFEIANNLDVGPYTDVFSYTIQGTNGFTLLFPAC